MPNLDALKSRVERAERNIKSAQTTREMESQALVEMWRQIRQRFEGQEGEIQVYRDKLDAVEDQHEELCKLVETLLSVIEKSTGRAGEETVPRITGLAEAMLEGREIPDDEAVHDEPEIAVEPPTRRRRAKRDIRDLVTRVTEARRSVQDADDELDIADPREQDHDDIENLRSELDELGERLGVRRV